jgi:hypothetical protein
VVRQRVHILSQVVDTYHDNIDTLFQLVALVLLILAPMLQLGQQLTNSLHISDVFILKAMERGMASQRIALRITTVPPHRLDGRNMVLV